MRNKLQLACWKMTTDNYELLMNGDLKQVCTPTYGCERQHDHWRILDMGFLPAAEVAWFVNREWDPLLLVAYKRQENKQLLANYNRC